MLLKLQLVQIQIRVLQLQNVKCNPHGKKIAIEYTQKEMGKEFKILLQNLNTKEDRNAGNEGQTSYKTNRKQTA